MPFRIKHVWIELTCDLGHHPRQHCLCNRIIARNDFCGGKKTASDTSAVELLRTHNRNRKIGHAHCVFEFLLKRHLLDHAVVLSRRWDPAIVSACGEVLLATI